MLLLPRKGLGLHTRWIVVFLVGTLAASLGYLIHAFTSSTARWPGGSSLPGFVCGVLAGGIILFEFFLWPRKWPRVRAWRIGRTQVWLRAHIWLGLLTVPLVIYHHGLDFHWGGQLTVMLMVLFWCVIASGIFGLALQQVIPRMMFDALPAETIYSQVGHVARQNARDAEDLVLKACGAESTWGDADELDAEDRELVTARSYAIATTVRSVGRTQGKSLGTDAAFATVEDPTVALYLRQSFFDDIKPYLELGHRADSRLTDATRATAFYEGMRRRLDLEIHPLVEKLQQWSDARRQFDLQSRLHHWLHGWLAIHLPLSIALVVLLLAHVYYAVKYW
ncbi:MAG: hypothetical protein DWQ35_12260 [Planctomycetota bacterium]|nr:MAG: hypothetical protein DWQ35_12260 [Planctomycetota bacterium]REK18116.1 MAG: hypothetical protein DWQ42_20805 [Planctomycetota bacterium]REK44216.1 MAG: hypothetical protein DWQ46_10540 [Planctomycetota bacterium]